ncbi:MAG: bacillithiol biosynthesis deacetylase BshB1, partial [bacterium]
MIDILAIGAHPDDVELGAAGFLMKMKDLGYKTAVLDLTRGEMGSRGSADIRAREADAAAELMGLEERRSLDLRDSHLEITLENRHKLAKVIRELKPTFLIAPYFVDKHPDHGIAGRLVKLASFDARLKKLDLEVEPHPVRKIFYFPCHQYFDPDFVVDITGY